LGVHFAAPFDSNEGFTSVRYSAFSLAKHALSGHEDWTPAWRNPEPKSSYDVIIVGGGGHGLATAYYLAAKHGITNVAVLERGWIGGGNTGRNTTIIRSNYFFRESADIYELSLQLYETLSEELNFNIMFSQRGLLTLGHNRHDEELLHRWTNALHVNGVDGEFMDAKQVRDLVPILGDDDRVRYPVRCGMFQRRAGVARHDAVAWGYARAADALGVDIIQNCEVTAFTKSGNRAVGVETSRGTITAGRVALCVAGHSSVMAQLAGFDLPVTSYALQAFVSEPIKPVLDVVVLSPMTGAYVSQSDKGELVVGAGLDLYPSYGQRGNAPITEATVAGLLDMFPSFSRLRMLRQWAGIVDVVHDSSPILGRTPIDGLYINCGWGTGGFKAIPGGGLTMAETIANERPHKVIEPFGLERFTSGRFVNEAAAAGIAH
jgi:sarcosine oxidase, subunit beta